MYIYANFVNEMDPKKNEVDFYLQIAADKGHEKAMIAYTKRLLSNKNSSSDKIAADYLKWLQVNKIQKECFIMVNYFKISQKQINISRNLLNLVIKIAFINMHLIMKMELDEN